MVAAKSKVHTSLVKNPPRGAKPVKNRGNAAKYRSKPASRRSTPKTARKTSVRSRRRYQRNGVAQDIGVVVAAFGGALVITGFDYFVNKVAPNVSVTIRTLGKFAAGFAVGHFGAKAPIIGKYSGVIQSALYIAGALDVVGNYILPPLMAWLAPASASASPTPVKTESGELGWQYTLPTGQKVVVVNKQQQQRQTALAPTRGFQPAYIQ